MKYTAVGTFLNPFSEDIRMSTLVLRGTMFSSGLTIHAEQ
jgi:hypothetical protein